MKIVLIITSKSHLTMASPLEVSTLVEQRSVIRFLLSEGENPSNIYSRMTKQYGESCMNRGNFISGWISSKTVSYTHLDVYKRQVERHLSTIQASEMRSLRSVTG